MNYYLLLSNYSAVCTLNTSTTGLKSVAATSAINSVTVVSQIYTTPLTTSTINRPVNHSEVVASDFSSDKARSAKYVRWKFTVHWSARSTVCR